MSHWERGIDLIAGVTGIILMPGNQGKDCPGNSANPAVSCCCDECDSMLYCFDTEYPSQCSTCKDCYRPRAGINQL